MAFPTDRKFILIGAGVAVVAGVAIAAGLLARDGGPRSDPPASKGGLVVEMGTQEESKLDPARPLRCFVSGQFVGELTLAECASRNGVGTGALDVGVDETGALAAADEAGMMLTPLPPPQAAPAPAPTPSGPIEEEAASPVSSCWRYEAGQWSRIPGEGTMNECVQILYAGRCDAGTSYGRWGDQTLRLTSGRIEASNDNRRFRTIAPSVPGCAPPAG
ncbi:hypothetical protein ABOZ73_16560 [Caulobacter sp. 73W]|uniref:Uncharacterized protein n=1 Tax=Caulobacter sp. 73W TaxID=3161137 RepID=A0AB39KSH6_9CAUL